MKARTERKNHIGRIIGLMLIMVLTFALTVMADVPGAVSLRKAKPGVKRVKLVWKTVSGANGYNVYRVKKDGTKLKLLGKVTKGSAKSVVVKKLKNGKTYNFAVAAYNSDGEGALSNVMSAAPQFTDPGPVKDARLNANKNRYVIIRWGANSKATDYQILTENASGEVIPVTTVSAGIFKLKIKGLKNGRIYKFYVRAVVKKGKQVAYGALSSPILGRPISNKKLKAAVGNIHPYYYKAKTLAKLTADGVSIGQGADVLIVKRTSGKCTIQYKKKLYKVPTSALSFYGVKTKASKAPDKAGAEAFVNAKGYQSGSKYLIWTNTYTQHLYIFEGSQYNWKLIKHHACSTGSFWKEGGQWKDYTTPIAVSEIYTKRRIWFFGKEDAIAKGLDIQVGYWASRIKGGAIHSWMYNWSNEKRTTGKDPDGYPAVESEHAFRWSATSYGKAKSHACIRVPIELSKWIYDNVPVYTTNVVY